MKMAKGVLFPQLNNFSVAENFRRHGCLFQQFAPRRVGQGFPQFHRAAGKSPASLLRFVFPLDKNNLVASERDRENGDFWIDGCQIRTVRRG